MTNDYGAALDAPDRRARNGIPARSADARRARGSRTGRTALRRHARRRIRLVRSGQALADAAAEPAGDAGHRLQGPPRRSRSRRRWGASFWIMDNVAPLRQIAASVTKPHAAAHDRRAETAQVGSGAAAARARSELRVSGSRCRAPRAEPAQAPSIGARRTAAACVEPRSNRSTDRMSSSSRRRRPIACATRASSGRPDLPEYPPPARGSTTTSPNPSGEVKLEILDAAGAGGAHATRARRLPRRRLDAAAAGAAAACRRRCRRRPA